MLNHNPSQRPSFSPQAFLGVTWAGVAISLGFLVFRMFVRFKFFKRLFIDDALVIAAWVMTLANAAIWQVTIGPLYMTVGVTSGQITTPPPDFEDKFFAYSHAQFATYILYYASLYTTKLSFLFFFRKLGERVRRQQIIWWTALVFVFVSYSISFSLVDFRCLAGPRSSALVECASPHAAHYEGISLRTAAALDIVTDASIILVSTNILWNVQINLRKKLALGGICSLTAFIICVSVTRVIVSLDGPFLDILAQVFWANLELSIAIIVASLASFRTLYTRSKRQKCVSPEADRSDRARIFQGGSRGFSHNNMEGNATHITANEETYELRPQRSSTSSKERIVPLNGVYVRHDFSVLPGPPEVSQPPVNEVLNY